MLISPTKETNSSFFLGFGAGFWGDKLCASFFSSCLCVGAGSAFFVGPSAKSWFTRSSIP